MRETIIVAIAAIPLIFFSGCKDNSKKVKYDPYSITPQEKIQTSGFEIPFKFTGSNLKTIHVNLNNSVGYDALFDTGCSSMQISEYEAFALYKSGTLVESNISEEKANVTIADGSQLHTMQLLLREISVTDTKGEIHSINNIPVVVMKDLTAPVLVGSFVIDRLATSSYTVDLDNRIIRFN